MLERPPKVGDWLIRVSGYDVGYPELRPGMIYEVRHVEYGRLRYEFTVDNQSRSFASGENHAYRWSYVNPTDLNPMFNGG